MLITSCQHFSINDRNLKHSYVTKNHETDDTNAHVNNETTGVMDNVCVQDKKKWNEGRRIF